MARKIKPKPSRPARESLVSRLIRGRPEDDEPKSAADKQLAAKLEARDGAPIRIEPFRFSLDQVKGLKLALKKDFLEENAFIRELETCLSMQFSPWRSEPARLPGLKARRAGLKRVAELACELRAAISADDTCIVAVDRNALDKQLAVRVTPGVVPPIDATSNALMALEAAASAAARSIQHQRQKSTKQLLADELAFAWFRHFNELPTAYANGAYMNVFGICVCTWLRTRHAGELRRPATEAVKRLRNAIKQLELQGVDPRDHFNTTY